MLVRTLRELAAPNVRLFTTYRLENLRPDLVAGISVAAVQIPTAIAYAQLAGFPPLIGLYASILPSVVYALFGSSRQLMMGPDAATCAMVAATLLPLAGADPARYLQLSMALAAFAALGLSRTFSHARFSTASLTARASRSSLANSARSSASRWKGRISSRASRRLPRSSGKSTGQRPSFRSLSSCCSSVSSAPCPLCPCLSPASPLALAPFSRSTYIYQRVECEQRRRGRCARDARRVSGLQSRVHPESFGIGRGKLVGRKDEEPSLSWIWNQGLPVSSDAV